MSDATPRDVNAITLSKAFFHEIVRPLITKKFPELLSQGAFGRFGYGSECLGLDDPISRDHQWGPRVDILLPRDFLESLGAVPFRTILADCPDTFRGFPVKAAHVGEGGLAPEAIETFLTRTLGRTAPPETPHDWLDFAEEDIVHVVGGEVFHDKRGEFSRIREILSGYYPAVVWHRRIAHWCRYASGMGLYAMRRAFLRGNLPYACTSFGRTLKTTLELVHLLNRRYFTYDKWLYPLFCQLPEVAPQMLPLVDEAVQPATPWPRRIVLFEQAHDLVDRRLVELAIIASLTQPLPARKQAATDCWSMPMVSFAAGCPPKSWPMVLLVSRNTTSPSMLDSWQA